MLVSVGPIPHSCKYTGSDCRAFCKYRVSECVPALIWTPLGQKKMSSLVRCPDFRESTITYMYMYVWCIHVYTCKMSGTIPPYILNAAIMDFTIVVILSQQRTLNFPNLSTIDEMACPYMYVPII